MTDIWSIPESLADYPDLPVSVAPPWPSEVKATMWWHRATRAGRALARSRGSDAGRGRCIPITVGMVVDYTDSAVGPYREILASPVLWGPGEGYGRIPQLSIPFISVNSPVSAHGGRVHWWVPKVLGDFGGDVLAHATVSGSSEAGAWSVSTRSAGHGPGFPTIGSIGWVQPTDDGLARATVSMRGKTRLARVDVEVTGPTLPGWLRSGRHLGLQVISGKMVSGPLVKLR